MFSVTVVLYEKDGVVREDALRYWREVHGPIDKEIPGLRRYVQQHAVGAPEGEPPFLGVATLYFDDEDAWTTAAASQQFADAVADVPNFASTKLDTAFVEEVPIVG